MKYDVRILKVSKTSELIVKRVISDIDEIMNEYVFERSCIAMK